MDHDDIPDVFWEALKDLSFDLADDPIDALPALPVGLTAVLEVADESVTFGRTVNLVGDPASSDVAYSHVILQQGRLAMRLYFPAQPVPGTMGIPAYIIGFRDLPQVRRMYEVRRVLSRLSEFSDERAAYSRAVSVATVKQASRALAGLASLERLPFTLYPLDAA